MVVNEQNLRNIFNNVGFQAGDLEKDRLRMPFATQSDHSAAVRYLRSLMLWIGFSFYRTMVVAVVTMRVMEAAIDDVIGVISVWHRLVSATGTVDVSIFMYHRLAMIWIYFIDLQTMLIIVIEMLMV